MMWLLGLLFTVIVVPVVIYGRLVTRPESMPFYTVLPFVLLLWYLVVRLDAMHFWDWADQQRLSFRKARHQSAVRRSDLWRRRRLKKSKGESGKPYEEMNNNG